MKILIPTTPIPGHLNPLLGLARILVKHGHEVLVQTGSTFKPMVEAARIPLIPLLPEADVEPAQFFAKHPEIHEKKPFEWFGFAIENFFLPRLPAQVAGLEMALHDFPADVILTESMFYGTLPLLLGRRQNRPTIVHVGITVLDLFEYAREHGLSTGAISNDDRQGVTNALTAAFFAHNNNRGKSGEIFEEMIAPRNGGAGLDVAYSGGRSDVLKQVEAMGKDGAADLKSHGYAFVDSLDALRSVDASETKVVMLNTFRRVFMLIDPEDFESRFTA
jgi:hypothetical protein